MNIDQKTIAQHLVTLTSHGFRILDVNWSTGEIRMVLTNFHADILTDEELKACAMGKIHGIKKVRETRGMGLADAKAFVEAHYAFPPPQAY